MNLFDRMDTEMVRSMMEAFPAEVTIIDANDEVVGWNKHETRLFKRPMTSMGLNFRQCHPEKSLAKVEQIISEMRSGQRDKARFWIDLPIDLPVINLPVKHKILIEFFALRDFSGKYLGCMEVTQDVEEIRGLQGEKRLLD
jgi:DUF438 domain-containing protein